LGHTNQDSTEGTTQATGQGLSAPVPSPTILCVDDEPTCLLFRKLVLQKAGYTVLCARNGTEALALFEAQKVDCVVLDLLMPGMDGEAAARRMRQAKPEIPIVILSASFFPPDEVMKLVDAYVAKAQSPTVLLREVHNLLNRRIQKAAS